MPVTQLDPPSGLPIFYRGTSLEKGKLPALFYFALSGHDSLALDPFNQPALFFEKSAIRIYSCSIPGHDPGLNPRKALEYWSEEITQNRNPLESFFTKCLQNLDFLIEEGLIDQDKIAVAGLSRGAFIATHLAARDSRIGLVLGFAPLTSLKTLKTATSLHAHPLVESLSLDHLIPHLVNKKVRYYIGNRDLCVGTEICFQFIHQLAETAYQNKHRSPEVELTIYPSIGYLGHGTPPHIFQQGADWIQKSFAIGTA